MKTFIDDAGRSASLQEVNLYHYASCDKIDSAAASPTSGTATSLGLVDKLRKVKGDLLGSPRSEATTALYFTSRNGINSSTKAGLECRGKTFTKQRETPQEAYNRL